MIRREVAPGIVQISLDEKRWYYFEENKKNDLVPFPAVTWILNEGVPKSIGFEIYLADKVHSWEQAKQVLNEAGDQGSKVHWGLEQYAIGQKVNITDTPEEYYVPFTSKEWSLILKGVDWFTKYEPRVLSTEVVLFHMTEIYAGTADMICMIDKGMFLKEPEMTGEKERWLIDWKTSGAIYRSHKMQVAAYVKCLEGIDRFGIVRVGSKHKCGYEFWQNEEGDLEKYYNLFLNAKAFWADENPDPKPKTIEVPESIQLIYPKEGKDESTSKDV